MLCGQCIRKWGRRDHELQLDRYRTSHGSGDGRDLDKQVDREPAWFSGISSHWQPWWMNWNLCSEQTASSHAPSALHQQTGKWDRSSSQAGWCGSVGQVLPQLIIGHRETPNISSVTHWVENCVANLSVHSNMGFLWGLLIVRVSAACRACLTWCPQWKSSSMGPLRDEGGWNL